MNTPMLVFFHQLDYDLKCFPFDQFPCELLLTQIVPIREIFIETSNLPDLNLLLKLESSHIQTLMKKIRIQPSLLSTLIGL